MVGYRNQFGGGGGIVCGLPTFRQVDYSALACGKLAHLQSTSGLDTPRDCDISDDGTRCVCPDELAPCTFCLRPSRYVLDDGNDCCDECWWKKSGVTPASAGKGVAAACGHCGLPLGELAYCQAGTAAVPVLLHGECVARMALEGVRGAEDARQRTSAERKRAQRELYKLGWDVQQIPCDLSAAAKLGCTSEHARPFFCVEFDVSKHTFRAVEAVQPAGVVNLEYLSIALQVRRMEGREPYFSLDPTPTASWKDRGHAMQVKRFEPAWLMGTSVGEVMFQADYLLKELSMGEHDQPVVGMRSSLDFHDEGVWAGGGSWSAREWFVVNKAEVQMASDGILVPRVDLAVEVREQVATAAGWEDALVTRPDHPLVLYAKQFTKNFDLIAERRSVIFHLRELAKAALLAKFMLGADEGLDDVWFGLFSRAALKEAASRCFLEIPQLWNERCHAEIQVSDGVLVDTDGAATTRSTGVYGGVQFGLDRFDLPLARSMASQSMTLPNLRTHAPSVAMAAGIMARKDIQVLPYLRPLSLQQIGARRPLGGQIELQAGPGPAPAYPNQALSIVDILKAAAAGAGAGFAVQVQAAPAVARIGALAYPQRGARVPALATGAFRHVSGMAPEAQQRLMGVDLGLERFNVSEAVRLADEPPSARVTFGERLFAEFDDFEEQPALALLKDVFDPRLCDRRAEAANFRLATESEEYFARLGQLVGDEKRVRLHRQEHFFSSAFDAGQPGPLFPRAWTQSVRIASWRDEKRPDLDVLNIDVDVASLELTVPMFDGSAEDGLRYRIYRGNDMQVRTVQHPSGPEQVGAAFAAKPNIPASIWGAESVTKVAALVSSELDNAVDGAPLRPKLNYNEESRCYSLILRTQSNSIVLTEMLADGTVTWVEGTGNLIDRVAAAKTLACMHCKDARLTLQDLRSFATACRSDRTASCSERARFVQSTYNRVRRAAGLPPVGFLRRVALRQEHSRISLEDETVVGADVSRSREVHRAPEPSNASSREDCRLAALLRASGEFSADREVALAAVQQDGLLLKSLADELKSEHLVVMAAVGSNGLALEFAAASLRDDRDIVCIAVEQEGAALEFASPRLRADRGLVEGALRQNPLALAHASEHLRGDPELIGLAVRSNSFARTFVMPGAIVDRERVLELVQDDESVLEYVSTETLGERTFMLAAFERNGLALQYVAPELRSDRDFMLTVLQRNGFALRLADMALRSDSEVVAAAIAQDRRAIKYASSSSSEIHSSPITCHLGHELQHLRATYGCYVCDKCESGIPRQSMLWSCSLCCFDLCKACNERLELSIGEGAPQGVPASGSAVSVAHEVPTMTRAHGGESQTQERCYMVGSWDGWREPVELTSASDEDGRSCFRARVPLLERTGVVKLEIFDVEQASARYVVGHQRRMWKVLVPAKTQLLEVVRRPSSHERVSFRFLTGPEVTMGIKHFRCEDAYWSTPGPFYLRGSWDEHRGMTQMQLLAADGGACVGIVRLEAEAVPMCMKFQIVQDRDVAQCFYPDPEQPTAVLGPGLCDASAGWQIQLPAGCKRLHVKWDPRGQRSIECTLFGALDELSEIPRPPPSARYSVIGSWDGWQQPVDFMTAGISSLHAHIMVRETPGVAEFQIVQDKNLHLRFGPALGMSRGIKRYGEDVGRWVAGIPRGCRWLRVVWHPHRQRHRVSWSCLAASGEPLAPDRHARAALAALRGSGAAAMS